MSELETVRLAAGQQAPDFSIETVRLDGDMQIHTATLTLGELLPKANKGVIVYFFPRAMTPGCTREACDFQAARPVLDQEGYTVIGISPDPLPRLQQFALKDQLHFYLGSDEDHKIMQQWGVWGQKKLYGKTTVGVVRSTFVVDPQGRITSAQYNVKATGHVDRLTKVIGTLGS